MTDLPTPAPVDLGSGAVASGVVVTPSPVVTPPAVVSSGFSKSQLIPSIETFVTLLAMVVAEVQSYTGHLSGTTAAQVSAALAAFLGVLKTVQQALPSGN